VADVAVADPTAGWIQAGGVVAFAVAVLFELRKLGPLFTAITTVLVDVRTTMSALLERERARAERIAAVEARRAALVGNSSGVPDSWDDGPETQPIVIKQQRMQTQPGVYVQVRRKGGDG
jgi:hypothetical protein